MKSGLEHEQDRLAMDLVNAALKTLGSVHVRPETEQEWFNPVSLSVIGDLVLWGHLDNGTIQIGDFY